MKKRGICSFMPPDTTGTLFLPPQGSTISGSVDSLFHFILVTSTIFFLIIVLGALYFVLRYRKRANTAVQLTSGPTHSTKLELLWTIIPTILVFIVFLWGFKTYLRMHVVPGDALKIKVTAQKWFWSFDYTKSGAKSLNELVVPVGKPVELTMSSTDVIHSFYVPGFRIKMDVLPNRYTVTWFEATNAGVYDLFCAEYCGTGHSEMIGKVRAVGEREFSQWLEASSSSGEGMPLADYGAKLYSSKACVTCHTIDGTVKVGPSFKGLFGTQQVMVDGKRVLVDENYLRESILNPMAKVVAGFQPVMPSFQGLLNDKDIDALVEYIKSLQE